ncbi:MAG TPA: hypothetical protein VG892_04250 [Terriglobales bacterium]|nr:hypothetical protein [Terriglobales bacterium]
MLRQDRIHSWLIGLLFLVVTAALPARAQVDLAGEWNDYPSSEGEPHIGEYMSVPLNDAARMRGDTWSAEKWTMVEHQCEPHPSDYGPRGPSRMRVWADVDSLSQAAVAWHTVLSYQTPERTIYMDGRPHPPEWEHHTWQGFSTGEWVADMLKITTTHMKEGWIRRNGLARSSKATMTEYLIRHENYMTRVTMVEDPVYLTEPWVLTSHYVLDLGRQLSPNYCIYSQEIEHEKGWVAHYLPGKNPWLTEYSEKSGIPLPAVRGGAETMYQEYQNKLAKMPLPVAKPENKASGGGQ